MTRTGIFGGSYNPVHVGHIALAKCFLKEAELDEVWLMVSPQNPLKVGGDLLDDGLRLEMVRAAVADEPGLVACDYEFHLPKPSYTWDTLQALRHDEPNREFTLLIGGDNWEIFPRWYKAREILANYRVMVYPRKEPGGETQGARHEGSFPAPRFLHAELIDVSSTDIRRRVRMGEPITGLVPSCIEEMVIANYSK